MSGDLISREAAMALARNHIGRTIDCNDIARLPAVDAEPVRHGWWIITFCGGAYYTRTSPFRYRCSECGLYSDKKYPYCHCGAKLDLEETE